MEQDTQLESRETGLSRFLNKAPFYILVILAFLIPLGARFGASVSGETIKSSVLAIGIMLVAFITTVGLLSRRFISFLKHPIVYGAALALLGGLLSASFSGEAGKAFLGTGFEFGTFFGLLCLFLVFFFTALFARSEKRISTLLSVLMGTFIIAGVVLIINAFAGGSWLGFESASQTLIGNWTDSALLFGLMALVSGILWELGSLNGRMKWLAIGAFVFSTLGLLFADFALAWWITGVSALAYTLYRAFILMRGNPELEVTQYKNKWVTPTLALIVLSAIFLAFGGDGSALDRAMSHVLPSSLDARPDWPITVQVAQHAWGDNLWFGTGLGGFSGELLKNKPEAINASPFWGVDFNYGVGYVPTFLVTEGLVGTIFWLAFLAVLGFYVVKTLLRDKRALAVALAFGTAVSWVLLIAFVPGTTAFFSAFLLTGLFLGYLVGEGSAYIVEKSTNAKTVFGFATVTLLIIASLGSLTLEYVFAQKQRALSYHAKAVRAMTESNDFASAATLLEKAVKISNSDVYLRTLVDARIADLALRLNQGKLSPGEVQTTFMNEYPGILHTAELAVAYDQEEYLNWVSLATAYQMALSLGVSNAYERALAGYQEALARNPKSPGIYLGLARLELARNNFTESKKWLDQALTLKPDYIDALYLHSQIAIRTGNTNEAIKHAITAASVSPDNVGLLFQLGILYYTNGNYVEAAQVLSRAVTLQDNFSNAHYYLGLTYYKLDKKDLAQTEFEKVLKLNPENTLAQKIVENIRAGNDPLLGVSLTGATELPNLLR